MLNYIIMDDDMNHNLNMKKRLDYIFEKYSIDAAVSLVATGPAEVLKYSMESSGNVYFLDVDCGCDITGIELAGKIREHDARSYIIFVSGHPEFVLPSLKAKIFDFLVKPICAETLEKCVLAIHKDLLSLKNEEKQTLVLKSGMTVHQLNVDDIVFLEKYGHLLVVHLLNGQISSQESLDNIENKLDRNMFFRCHKSYIANTRYISKIDYKSNIIYFENRQTCLFSKRCKKELKTKCPAL